MGQCPSCPSCPSTTSCPVTTKCPVTTSCPVTTKCPVTTPCPTCPIQAPCPKLKLFYVENTSNQNYTAYWNNPDPNYFNYSYILSLSTDNTFNNGNTYSYDISSPPNSNVFVSNITASIPFVSYAKISMLTSGNNKVLLEESNIINISNFILNAFTLNGNIATLDFSLSYSFAQKIKSEWISPGAEFYPINFTMSCITNGIISGEYSAGIPIIQSQIQGGKNIVTTTITNLGCTKPSYIRLFTVLPSRQDPYYSNYVQPRSV